MKALKTFLAYLLIALALSMLTITVLNGYNPMMRFLTSTPSRILIFAFGIVAILNGILHLHDD